MQKRKDNKGRVLQEGESLRSDGRYCFRYSDNGTRKTIYAKTLQELRAKEESLDVKKQSPSGKMSIMQLGELYLQANTVRESSRLAYISAFKNFDKFFGDKRIDSIKRCDIDMYIKQTLKVNTATTVRDRMIILSMILNYAVYNDFICKNPTKGSVAKIPHANIRESLTVKEEADVREFLAYYNDEVISAMLLIALDTGMRISEITGLTWDNIDFKNRMISVKKQLVVFKGVHVEYSTKSKSGIRSIPMNDEVFKALSIIKDNDYFKSKKIYVGEVNEFVFVDRCCAVSSDRVRNWIKRNIARYNSETGNEIRMFTPHELRHTFCTRKYEQGMPLNLIQYIMGHEKESEITKTVYVTQNEETNIELSRKFI